MGAILESARRHLEAIPSDSRRTSSARASLGGSVATVVYDGLTIMKASEELLKKLRHISEQLNELSGAPEQYELDTDAVVDLRLARESVDKLINRLERIVA